MKNATELLADIKAAAEALAALQDTNTTFIIMHGEGDEFHGHVGGSPAGLASLTARVMLRDEKFHKTMEKAVEMAPIMRLFEVLRGADDDGTPCDCERCTAKAKDPNVS